MYSLNSSGYPLQRFSIGTSVFFFLIFAYFSAFDLPGSPYHGREPIKK
tara:strand:+ start:232 stop:375 length:144 start_codon:yes stop_codon:yes gene_type:complete